MSFIRKGGCFQGRGVSKNIGMAVQINMYIDVGLLADVLGGGGSTKTCANLSFIVLWNHCNNAATNTGMNDHERSQTFTSHR